MISIDTNVLIRILTNDDKVQAKKAAKLIQSNDIYVTKTMILETEWVLRFSYKLKKNIIIDSIRKFIALDNVSVNDSYSVNLALDLSENGMDFADALHIASSYATNKFATFDKNCIQTAKKANSPVPVVSV